MIKKITLLLTFTFIFSCVINAQTTGYQPSEERASFQLRKKSIMDGNRLRATYHNSGHAGRYDGQNTDEILFEFPINTDRTYIYFVSAVMGAEVENQDPNSIDDVFPIINLAEGRTSSEGNSWTMNPIAGYARPVEDTGEMARSDRGPESALGNTWPNVWPDKLEDGGDGWAGSWNGYFGRDQFSADLEFYYKAGDDLYTKFLDGNRGQKFQPDSTDPTRGGLGILMDTRILAWSQTLINSTHFNIFEITNDGSHDYRKVAFGLWIADLIVGQADTPEFDDLRSIAFISTSQRIPAPEEFDGPIGEMGVKFLETPGNSIDGIDNDGDSYYYDQQNAFFDPDNVDIYSFLTGSEGFFTRDSLVNSVIPEFTITAFNEVTICPGDKIVLITDSGDRIISQYPENGESVYSRGQIITSDGTCIDRLEDFLPAVAEGDPYYKVHVDQIDNDLDGLIDENKPNHLSKATFINNAEEIVAVRYINYLNFAVGDTIQKGLIVPNTDIKDRMGTDSDFNELVINYQNQLRTTYGDSRSNDFYNNYFINYFTAAPMLDEARDDLFDNDNDWFAVQDDVGIQGNEDAASTGNGDGFPTSGAGTTFPGEPNIDKTDVAESDQLGVSRARIFAAGTFPSAQDISIWNNFLLPGDFERSGEAGRDDDIFVSSSLFPLAKGQTERFAVAITGVQTKSANARDDRDQTNANLDQAFTAYDNDYQFAVAPEPPIVRAVASDGKVTLYWEDNAEQSFDRYVQRITGNGFDFEGYKIYKATDESFEEILNITDAFGNPQFNTPLAIFDKNNGNSGLHPVPVNGVQYNLGRDTGLSYSYEDTVVTNGRRYFYAVTSFDFGAEAAGIAPSESRIQISRNPDGSIILGPNVIEIRPAAEQAGYISPENPMATIANGSPGGTVEVEMVDSRVLREDNIYSVTFEDTLFQGQAGSPDTVKTKNFTLRNVTDGISDTLISRSENFNGEDLPVIEGFRLTVINETESGVDEDRSGWNSNRDVTLHNYQFVVANTRQNVADYEVVFSDQLGFGQSSDITIERAPGTFQSYPSVPTNFKVVNKSISEDIKFAYAPVTRNSGICSFEPEVGVVGEFSAFRRVGGFGCAGALSDNLYFIEDFRGEEDVATYRIRMSVVTEDQNGVTVTISENPTAGDTISVVLNKPFIEGDEFRFRVNEENIAQIDNELASEELDDIKVVPNPYIVTNPYEISATSTNRQQQRELHFTNLPIPSTLRIFTISGFLVEEIEITQSNVRRAGGDFGGTYVWDMLTKDNLEISFGVYIYHVNAPGVGDKTGKFAVIK